MESLSVENLSENQAVSLSASTNDLKNNNKPLNVKTDCTSESSINNKMEGELSPSSVHFDYRQKSPSLEFNSTGNKLSNDDNSGINSSTSSINNSGSNNTPLNEKVAHLASSIYTELEKIVKLHGRDTVKDLMSIVVNVLEGLDTAYQDKEELIVENELLKDDYEKLLSQYEREKQARKDTELKLFQSEDSFAEQKKECEEKVKSLESIVRMIDLKSKNTSDHVIRLEEKEVEFKKEYNKLHERYTELFKNHCDYMERTKILFGNDNRFDSNTVLSNPLSRSTKPKGGNEGNSKQLLDILKTNNTHINRNDLINTLKASSRAEINIALSNLLSQDLNQSGNTDNNSTIDASSSSSLSSLSTQQLTKSNTQQTIVDAVNFEDTNSIKIEPTYSEVDISPGSILEENSVQEALRSKMNLHSSENFDEHLSSNCTEFDDTASDLQSIRKKENDSETDYEGEDETFAKNDQSLFNELSRENYDITELDDGADLTGMTREVANLIRENSELLQTKHALNVLKDDLIVRLDQFTSEMVMLREEIESLQTMKACLQLRITELEEEAKKAREELIQKSKKSDDEDETIPISQRKRFTRAEMARVLMERNQYKEKLMDLQEAVRWTEMMRASKVSANPLNTLENESAIANETSNFNNYESHSEQPQEQKKKTTLWKFFSDLFGASSQSSTNNSNMTHSHTTNQIQRLNPTSSNSSSINSSSTLSSKTLTKTNSQNIEQVVPHHDIVANEKVSKAYEFLKDEQTNSKASALNSKKDIKSELQLLSREEGRVQAYGWSLPSNKSNLKQDLNTKFTVSVPVPVYCRPLFEEQNNLKLSCSSSIDFSFNQSLLEDCQKLIETSIFSYFRSSEIGCDNKTPLIKTSCIWNCNLNDNDTHVSIMDANKPGNLVYQFTLKNIKIHTIQTVSGVKKLQMPSELSAVTNQKKINIKEYNASQLSANFEDINYIEIENDLQEKNDLDLNSIEKNDKKLEKSTEKTLTTAYPTMWMGSQEGYLLIHSSISNVSTSIEKIKLKDAILCIIQNGERVIVGLADGSAALFKRNSANNWDLKNFQLINFDKPHHSIRCLSNVNENVWCGCRNKIFVLNPIELKILTVIEVHPRKENQVRHIVSVKDGVWISIRLDSTLRLYHSKTYQPLQYLDIEPFITRMLGTSNLGLSLIRISSLIIGSKRLWIGTGNGVVLSIPFTDKAPKNSLVENKSLGPGSVVRVDKDNGSIPYCDISDTQFSFHGHRDSIKFFLNVPSEIIQKASNAQKTKSEESPLSQQQQAQYEKIETNLILSGGHGYIDFRIGDLETSNTLIEKNVNQVKTEASEISSNNKSFSKNDRSHLIVWQINNYN